LDGHAFVKVVVKRGTGPETMTLAVADPRRRNGLLLTDAPADRPVYAKRTMLVATKRRLRGLRNGNGDQTT
jgi:hypothetical protein